MFRIPSALLLVSAAIPSAGRLAAQEPPPAGAPQQPRESGRELRGQESGLRPPGIPREQLAGEGWPFLSWRHATGAWGGVRSWLEENGIYRGRPVDVAVMKDGSLLVSDDFAGAIYRVTYSAP